jgi:mannosyltransferase
MAVQCADRQLAPGRHFAAQRWLARAMLVAALVIGVSVRFHHLGRAQMDVDEGASWAGASVPTLGEVVAVERQIDPGKFALYDLMLHEWIGAFGDDLPAMRAMSAVLGTIAIVLVFAAVREACRNPRNSDDASAAATGELAGALAALAIATNLTLVLSDRTARMYSLTLAAELTQVIFLLRARQDGGLRNYAGVACFSAIVVAANFSALFLLLAEGVWLLWLLGARRAGQDGTRRPVALTVLSIVAGMAMLVPLLQAVASTVTAAVHGGIIDWIKPRPFWWPMAMLEQWTGWVLFAPLAALAVFGAWRQWGGAESAPAFFLAWLMIPIVAVAAFSWTVMPLMVPRYLLGSLVAFFALAALGIASIDCRLAVLGLAAVLAFVSLQRIHRHFRRPQGAQWREAVELARASAGPRGQIAVVPYYAADVVRYCLPAGSRELAVGYEGDCGPARVAILAGATYVPDGVTAKAQACYPRVLAKLRHLEVRAR